MELHDIIERLNSTAVHLDNALVDIEKVRVGTQAQTDESTREFLEAISDGIRGMWAAVAGLSTEAQEQVEAHEHHHHAVGE